MPLPEARPHPRTARAPAPRARRRGFTLIELLIALVLAGILASIALPSFFDTVRKGRRSDAFAALTLLQQAQERWRASNAAYSTDLTALGVTAVTASGHYAVSVSAADATSYTLRAVARGSQAQDKNCSTMALRTANGAVQYGSACSTCELAVPLTDPSRCWSRQ
ncbi:MAG: prepilin-type N-terminal cleavage/methylation domain-containing protein [Rubrivivax sp.]|nr:prepilin-type N-terminal cleavage/methylation domain-containing protein [Rubrivivax sp.]